MPAKSLYAVMPRQAQRNWELSRDPLIPDARALFGRMHTKRADEPLDAKVFRVGGCQKALDRACKKVGADRITHHDLRQLFATRHRIGHGHSNCFTLAGTQGRRPAGHEDLRPLPMRTLHCSGSARHVHTGAGRTGTRDPISCHCIVLRCRSERKNVAT
jgi:hypothetical protein